ncbi:apolipoprotein N-acyltransferase [Seohaeicola nanhaiensis]|uniref:Apolipoprotein N-acyltransferase n=1 Tax=Seohaeicola nanhaiensis TaxID=1387282 RepID=A0ABV9KGS5_9RHOB
MSPVAHWPLWSRLGLAGLSGAVAAFGLAPWGLWWASVAGFAMAAMLLNASDRRRDVALTGWAFGAGWFAHALTWIVEPFLIDVARHGWMAPFAVVLMCGGLALFWGAAFWAAAALTRAGPTRVVALVVTWTSAEALRGYVFTGFSWAAPGQVWIDTPVAALLAWVGPIGLDFAMLAAVLPLGLVLTMRNAQGLLAALPAAIVLTVALAAYQARPEVRTTGKIVRIVQPNIPQDEKWDRAQMAAHFQRQVDYTAAAPRPDLVVWPETAVPVLLDEAGPALDRIANAAQGAQVAAGIQRWEDGKWFNSLIRLDSQGMQAGLYDKHHLVPFGEFIPLGWLAKRMGITALADNFGDGFSAGPGPRLMDFGPLGQAVPLICYEAVFARDSGNVPGRADFLLQITNDAWFGQRTGPFQHLAQARMRAIEQGLPLIRSANTGISAMIDPAGHVIDHLPLGKAGYIDVALPAPFPATVYSRSGDGPILALLGLLLLAVVGGQVLRLRAFSH